MRGFENLEKAKNMLSDAKTLRTVKSDMKATCHEKPSIDKYGIGFNLDNRFAMFSATISFDSWVGYYGSSSCSTFAHANNREEVVQSFHAYVAQHEDEILSWMADHLIQKAEKLQADVDKELLEAKNALEELQQSLKE